MDGDFVVARAVELAVCDAWGVTPEQLRGQGRTQRLSDARTAFCALTRCHTGMTLDEIAGRINRDHTTVIHHTNKSKDRETNDPSWTATLDYIWREAMGTDD